MDAFKGNVKEALDEYVFSQYELGGKEKREFIERVKKAQPTRKKGSPSLKAAMAAIAAAILLVLLSIPFADVFTNTGSTTEIEKEASNFFGHEVTVPVFKKYPITFAALDAPKQLGHKNLSVNYAMTKGEPDSRLSSKEDIERWEKANESHLLYGPYSSRPILRLTFNNLKPILDEAKTKNINGHEVEYNLLLGRPAGDFYIAYVRTSSGTYQLEFFLNKRFTIEDADQMIAELTMQLKE